MATSTALAGQAFRMTAREAAAALKGWVLGGDPETALAGVSTDSRTVAKGNLFIALKGDAFDGHEYVAKAAQGGAAAALVLASKAKDLGGAGIPLITVEDDTLLALGRLGRAHRDRLRGPVVGITGSAGKSTAKEMTAAVLSWGGRRVLKTEGNLNNRIGVPLTVMSVTEAHAAAVVEMGISLPGEMPELVKVARPDVRVVLNAGASHLEFLGSPDGVAAEKARIWDDYRADDWMVFNADDERVSREAGRRLMEKRLSFGRNGADVRIQEVRPTGFGETDLTLLLRGNAVRARLRIFGGHHVTNAAAAAAVGLALDVPHDEIVAGLESRFAPMPGRGDIRRLAGDVALVDDSYNSNPTSARASLAALADTKFAGRKRVIAALGDMLELGAGSAREHERVGGFAALLGTDRLYLFGPQAPSVAAGARSPEAVMGIVTEDENVLLAGHHRPAEPIACRVFDTRPALAEALLADLRPGDAVLVKGSRGMKMEEVVGLLVAGRGVA